MLRGTKSLSENMLPYQALNLSKRPSLEALLLTVSADICLLTVGGNLRVLTLWSFMPLPVDPQSFATYYSKNVVWFPCTSKAAFINLFIVKGKGAFGQQGAGGVMERMSDGELYTPGLKRGNGRLMAGVCLSRILSLLKWGQ